MDVVSFLPWLFAGILVFIHYFGDRLNDTAFAHQEKITSLSAGVTITYVFLQLLPEHHKGLEFLGEFGSLTVLAGFTAIHLTEKWVYQHEKTTEEIRNDFRELHSVFLFLYYFALGLLIHELVQASVLEGTLFFIPVMFHTAISSFSLIELDEELLNSGLVKELITIAALLGVGAASFLNIGPNTFHIILGSVTGMFLYVVVHDSMPENDDGKPIYFITGMLLYTAIVAYVWLMF